jgi:putative spermidine/putrescine transport system permease protein
VPTIVLVVGFVPVYQVVQSVLGSDPWTLSFAIGVIVLPYAYRPIQANIGVLNLTTLTEAARSLGASWPVAVWRVVLPNLRRGLLSACLLTISVVLGEFTIANFLGQNTFQTALLLLQQTDPYVSAFLAVIVVAIIVVLLLPAMLLAELRFPKVHRILEFVCLIPITVPTIVLVVGFVPVYQVVQGVLGSDPWTLSFAIGVIVLPYAYRPIQANIGVLNLTTLTEAARSLGASWPVAVWRVVLPNLRRGLLSACLLTISVVLGEFTIANFLGQNTFQTALLLLQQTDPYVSAFLAVVSLLFVFVLLVVISTAGSIGRPRKKKS